MLSIEKLRSALPLASGRDVAQVANGEPYSELQLLTNMIPNQSSKTQNPHSSRTFRDS